MCMESKMHRINEMCEIRSKQKILILLCISIAITIGLTSTTSYGFATENKTLMQPGVTQNMNWILKARLESHPFVFSRCLDSLVSSA
jgi:hypothetical protein